MSKINQFRIGSIFFLLIIFNTAFGQSGNVLEDAKKLNQVYKFEEAVKILKPHYLNNVEDLYSGWLYAHTLHQAGDFKLSKAIYNATILHHPDNIELKLDRINKLAESGDFYNAIILTDEILDGLPDGYKYQAQKTLALIYFWKGDYDQSFLEIKKALKIKGDEPSAIIFRDKVVNARSNWLKADFSYFSDEQPLNIFNPKFEYGYYLNSMITIAAGLEFPVFSFENKTYTAPILNAITNFNFLKPKIGVRLELGGFRHPNEDVDVVGAVKIDKKLLKYMTVSLEAKQQPYLATNFAIKEKLMQTSLKAVINWNDPKGIIGELSTSSNLFNTINNNVQSYGAWAVSPPLKASKYEFRAGYGINYSDTRQNGFVAEEDINTIKENWYSNYMISGVYNPFYTPNEQLIHSVVGMVKYSPMGKMNLGLDINYGLKATTNAPYLYLGEGENKETIIESGFSKETYHPVDLNAYFNYKISEKFQLKAYFKFQKTFYYQSNLVGISSRIIF